jgi:hypothetical protein
MVIKIPVFEALENVHIYEVRAGYCPLACRDV